LRENAEDATDADVALLDAMLAFLVDKCALITKHAPASWAKMVGC
jgi:hypothetical protein